MIYEHGAKQNPSKDKALLYACPNINAVYTADSIGATRWDGDYPECAVCGRSKGHFAVHHEPPRGEDSLLLQTKLGQFVVKPALFLLCEECHRDRHDRAALSFGWAFDTPEDEELFLSGRFFADGWQEHDERMWGHGRLVVEHRGKTWEVRR